MHCSRTHLYPGCRITGGAGPVRASAIRVTFSDGRTVGAEMLDAGTGDDALALAVPEYRTRAGTLITERVWAVSVGASAGPGWDLVVGRRVA